MTIPATAVLEQLGFVRDPSSAGAATPAYGLDFGNGSVTAIEALSFRPFMTVVHVGGHWNTGRSLGLIDFEVPASFESVEQGVAWIAFKLGPDFTPARPLAWLDQGRSWQHHLPWERRRLADRVLAECTIHRDWFRPVAKHLLALAAEAFSADRATFTFDGEVLTIRARGQTLPMPATGDPWPTAYSVPVQGFRHLPKRLMAPGIGVQVRTANLTIAGLRLPLAPDMPPPPIPEGPRPDAHL